VIVEPMLPADRGRVALIGQLTRQTLDVAAEEARSWARLTVAREAPGGEAVALLLVWAVADELQVINVATHPDFRRRGAARALLLDALLCAVRDGVRLVLLEVRRSNLAAIRLYRSLGFTVLAIRERYYSDDAEDAVEMMLAIDPKTGRLLPGADQEEL
jgi:ribosomal-protein-alanine N-acetyltransferase